MFIWRIAILLSAAPSSIILLLLYNGSCCSTTYRVRWGKKNLPASAHFSESFHQKALEKHTHTHTLRTFRINGGNQNQHLSIYEFLNTYLSLYQYHVTCRLLCTIWIYFQNLTEQRQELCSIIYSTILYQKI